MHWSRGLAVFALLTDFTNSRIRHRVNPPWPAQKHGVRGAIGASPCTTHSPGPAAQMAQKPVGGSFGCCAKFSGGPPISSFPLPVNISALALGAVIKKRANELITTKPAFALGDISISCALRGVHAEQRSDALDTIGGLTVPPAGSQRQLVLWPTAESSDTDLPSPEGIAAKRQIRSTRSALTRANT